MQNDGMASREMEPAADVVISNPLCISHEVFEGHVRDRRRYPGPYILATESLQWVSFHWVALSPKSSGARIISGSPRSLTSLEIPSSWAFLLGRTAGNCKTRSVISRELVIFPLAALCITGIIVSSDMAMFYMSK